MDSERYPSIGKRVKRALADNSVTEDFLKEYLKEVRDNIKEASKSVHRYMALIFILAACFELLNRSALGMIIVGSVRIDKPAVIAVAIPPFIGFAFYQYLVNVHDGRRLMACHDGIFKIKYRAVFKNDLQVFLHPPASSLYHSHRISALYDNRSSLSSLHYYGIYWQQISFFLSIPIFLVYSFWQLFAHGSSGIVLTLISLAITIGALVYAWTFWALAEPIQDEDEGEPNP